MIQEVSNRDQLESIVRAGRGYLYNDFGGRDPKMCPIHAVTCQWVSHMLKPVAPKLTVRKIWSDDLSALIAKIESLGKVWVICGSERLEVRPATQARSRVPSSAVKPHATVGPLPAPPSRKRESAPDETHVIVPSTNPPGFEAWSTLRLSFDSTAAPQKAFKSALGTEAQRLAAGPGEMLEAVFTGERLAQECDAENVLHYNVGPGRFRDATRYGVRFERRWARPDSDRVARVGPVATHHSYRIVPCTQPSRHWRSVRTLVTLRDVPVGVLTHDSKPDAIWLETRLRNVTTASAHAGPFGLRVRWRVAGATGIAAGVKPLLDGLVSALHEHDGRDLEVLSASVARRVQRSATEISRLLMSNPGAVLGRRRLLWPRAGAHQWSPDDERCASATVLIEPPGTGAPGTMDIEVVAVETMD